MKSMSSIKQKNLLVVAQCPHQDLFLGWGRVDHDYITSTGVGLLMTEGVGVLKRA